jgi:chemotaxis protein MotB
VRPDQVTQVRGYADQILRVKNNPFDPSNRRITILVRNENGDTPLPAIAHAEVVDGAPAAPIPAAAPGTAKPQALPAAAVPAKPIPASPAGKPGLVGKLNSMMPVKKK